MAHLTVAATSWKNSQYHPAVAGLALRYQDLSSPRAHEVNDVIARVNNILDRIMVAVDPSVTAELTL